MAHSSNIGPLTDNLTVTEPLKPGDKVQVISGDRLFTRVWTGAKSSDLADPDNWRDTASSPAGADPTTAKEHPTIGKLRRSGMLAE